MSAAISILALAFFAASGINLYRVDRAVDRTPDLDLVGDMRRIASISGSESIELGRLEALAPLVLEQHLIARRHHHANACLKARMWAQYVGFVTGMILALVGSVFVLGKLRESRTDLKLEGAGELGLSLASSSPGVILCTLGTVLLMTTLIARHDISVTDAPVYLLSGRDTLATIGRAQDSPPFVDLPSIPPGDARHEN